MVGKIINKWISDGQLKREDIFVATKLHGMSLHPNKIEYYMKKSLDNLQFDYVDLYLIHFPVGLDHDRFLNDRKWAIDPSTDLEACWKVSVLLILRVVISQYFQICDTLNLI